MLEISWLGFARGGARRRLRISAQGSASAARRAPRRSPNERNAGTFTKSKMTAKTAAAASVPAIYYLREFAEVGGLMACGRTGWRSAYRIIRPLCRASVLQDAKPGDLPVTEDSV